MSALPVVLLPLGADDDALDACLAALEAGTPGGTRVWLADDARAGPRGLAIVEKWLAGTRMRGEGPFADLVAARFALRVCFFVHEVFIRMLVSWRRPLWPSMSDSAT